MRTKFKAWTKPYIDEHPEVMASDEFLKALTESYFLEIGSGKGKFICDMALAYPRHFFVGVERNVTCAGIAAKKIVEGEISNAKLVLANADEVLLKIRDQSIETIFLNFSDPWPKKRHHKRRLTALPYLHQYNRILVRGGRLIIKTDNDDLYAYSLETLIQSPLKIIEDSYDYDGRAEFDSMTEYELAFREKGQKIHRIVAEKND
ncbi:MAG: tRNA (guanosine(46)-N7)-methyltransferase TrmB [Bacilli bacterium]